MACCTTILPGEDNHIGGSTPKRTGEKRTLCLQLCIATACTNCSSGFGVGEVIRMERCAEVIRVGGAMVTLGIQIDRGTSLMNAPEFGMSLRSEQHEMRV